MMAAIAASALAAAVSAAAAMAEAPPPGAAVAVPVAERFPSTAAALAAALADRDVAVVAFGEFHQTVATADIPSALSRFTGEVLPVWGARFSHLIAETWVTTGRCGADERAVTADITRTTERPARTESEIEALLRVAHEDGIAP